MLFPLKLDGKGTDENLAQLTKYAHGLFYREFFCNNKSKSKIWFECRQLKILKYLQMCSKTEVN